MKSDSKQIHKLLDKRRTFDPSWHSQWHEDAVEVFIDPAESMTQRLAAYGAHVLTTFNYEALADELADVRGNYRSLRKVRDWRKVLMIGRDALNLTNETDIIDTAQTRPLSDLITGMGHIADTNAQAKKPIRQTRRLVHPAILATEAVTDDFIMPVDDSLLIERSQAALHSDRLIAVDATDGNQKSFHIARRGFRSVVHLGMASQLIAPSDKKLAFVKQGIELNRMYGEHHDMLAVERSRAV